MDNAESAKLNTATKYSMRGEPLLAQGATTRPLAHADNLWMGVKVYCGGGENALHSHRVEDHAFTVLQGKATFHFGDGSSLEVTQYEGVMIPKGVQYRFEAGTEENLVLLRVGAAQIPPGPVSGKKIMGAPIEIKANARRAPDGSFLDGQSEKNGTPSLPVIQAPGQYFAPVTK
jgi:mannose-6-phosphate isomerase-like protein (cupin superfamily)